MIRYLSGKLYNDLLGATGEFILGRVDSGAINIFSDIRRQQLGNNNWKIKVKSNLKKQKMST